MELIDILTNLPNPLPREATESDTRAQIIDPVLAAMGWTPAEIRREPYAGWEDSKGYIDYLLVIDGRPMMVVEAKKTGRTFGMPRALTTQRVTSYRKLRSTGSPDLKEALEQCLRYAQHTGAPYACVTNGTDWLIFKPTHPFRSLPDAKIIIFDGIDQILKRIDKFIDLLSPTGIQEGRAEKELLGRELQVPTFSKRLQDAFPYRGELSIEEEDYSNILDQMLKHYVVELTDKADFEECYLPAKGNRTTARSLEEVISGRIDAIKEGVPQTAGDFENGLLTQPLISGVAAGRTIILHGEVGVGKTSFLRHCELQLRAKGQLANAVWARVDLLPFEDRTFDPEERNAMLNLICKKIQDEVSHSTENMGGRYDPDSWDHLRDIYNAEVRKFQKARYPDSDDRDAVFLDEARKFVWSLSREDAQDHLVRIIRWLTVHCRLPVIVALDNSDQLGLEFQEFLFKLSETLKASTSAVVIVVLRTEALASHAIREHSIAAVREQFLVHKAPLALVLQKRFAKILNRLPEAYPGTANKAARDRMIVLMETLEYEAELGSDTFQVVEAAGNGSLRDSLRAVSAVFRSSPKSMDRLVVDQARNGRARLSVAKTLRALMRDDLGSADSVKLLPNVFNVDGQLTMPYSLGIRQLQQVRAKSSYLAYSVGALLNDLSMSGLDRTIVLRTLNRMRSDRFLSVSHMLPELHESDVLHTSRLGEVLLDIVLSEISYFSRSAFNTYVYEKSVYQDMRSAWTSGVEDYSKKLGALGRIFAAMVASDDVTLRQRIDLSILEPVVGAPLPGLLDGDRQTHPQET